MIDRLLCEDFPCLILIFRFLLVQFFICVSLQEKMPGKNKLTPRLLGITKESVVRMDEKTKEVWLYKSLIVAPLL